MESCLDEHLQSWPEEAVMELKEDDLGNFGGNVQTMWFTPTHTAVWTWLQHCIHGKLPRDPYFYNEED